MDTLRSLPLDGELPSPFLVWGPITIGILLSVFGMGIFLMQTIAYFDDTASTDSISLKSVILLILALNIGQTITDCSRLIKIDVWHAGDILYLSNVRARPEEVISPGISLAICTIAQIFLLRRCVKFARLATHTFQNRGGWVQYSRVVWRVVLFLGIVFSVVCGVISINALGHLNSLIEADRKKYPGTTLARWSTAWLSLTSATDIALSATLLWELHDARKNEDTSYKGKRALRAMIRVAWSNGVLVGALQLVSLLFLELESSSWADFPQIFISKVYSITLLMSITSPISALRSGRPPPLPTPATAGRHVTPLTPNPLPVLFMHKNPSREWSPYSEEMATPHGHGLQPFPLRNADCHSAEHARGDGRARIASLTSTSDWEAEAMAEAMGEEDGYGKGKGLWMGEGKSEEMESTSVWEPEEPEKKPKRVPEHLKGKDDVRSNKTGKSLMGALGIKLPKTKKEDRRLSRVREEEFSMDVRSAGEAVGAGGGGVGGLGMNTFGSVGGEGGYGMGSRTFGSVGDEGEYRFP
ncbi:uncharacterized protein MKK02DRAFT_40401 [Dioszegia hungarica]|uniref:DUF6534 domain-containing protein n=1 Tax=Dioszegia hungarica TaxID=4972 RepID=A0AA38H2Z9_9TREE|nr:uncharacterized protein MKK02DRAFT_40401 [Dioszegia hungarica]KAI9633020.1 hypothetical protein MKK02DRAFT_40401 [Dioszegia hungarica]